MKKKLMIGAGLLVGMVLLSGCMHETTPMSSGNNNLRGKTISFVPLDTLTNPNNGNSGGLFIDTMIMSSVLKGIENNMMSQPKYLYPTGILGSKAVNTLSRKYSMTLKPNNQVTDYKLEVKTYWYYKGVPLKWQKAQVFMENDIRLKDAKSGKVIAQAFCEYNPHKVKDIPMYSYDDIKNPNSNAVRAEANKAISLCINKFKREVLR